MTEIMLGVKDLPYTGAAVAEHKKKKILAVLTVVTHAHLLNKQGVRCLRTTTTIKLPLNAHLSHLLYSLHT